MTNESAARKRISDEMRHSSLLWLLSNLTGAVLLNVCIGITGNLDATFMVPGFFLLAFVVGLFRSLIALILHVAGMALITVYIRSAFMRSMLRIIWAWILCNATFFVFFFHKKPQQFFSAEFFIHVIIWYLIAIVLAELFVQRKKLFGQAVTQDDQSL